MYPGSSEFPIPRKSGIPSLKKKEYSSCPLPD
ncbi:hypothetical protein SIID45300_02093 [Candidatus Magnetaquicoccaceae bacterium FCR-1]|uniref:Uncharacterized protein n=1 Tax=Candidatus Magnetaquiglobus chichijimensis TaxID=3141448 RepID=A0ABQ0CA42_9PROT